jgi:hypothetical protein
MAIQNLRLVSYVRDLSLKTDKFVELDNLIRNAWKDRADAVAVMSPEILGDTYEELTANLKKLADARLLLAIIPPTPADHN